MWWKQALGLPHVENVPRKVPDDQICQTHQGLEPKGQQEHEPVIEGRKQTRPEEKGYTAQEEEIDKQTRGEAHALREFQVGEGNKR